VIAEMRLIWANNIRIKQEKWWGQTDLPSLFRHSVF